MNASGMLGFALGTAAVGSFFLGRFYGSIVDGVLRARGETVSVERRDELVLALERAAETATEETQRAFAAQLTSDEQQLLQEVFAAAMVDASRPPCCSSHCSWCSRSRRRRCCRKVSRSRRSRLRIEPPRRIGDTRPGA